MRMPLNIHKYSKIATILNNDQNLYQHNVCNLLYITNESEQDSYITGVYGYVKHEYCEHKKILTLS